MLEENDISESDEELSTDEVIPDVPLTEGDLCVSEPENEYNNDVSEGENKEEKITDTGLQKDGEAENFSLKETMTDDGEETGELEKTIDAMLHLRQMHMSVLKNVERNIWMELFPNRRTGIEQNKK